LCGIIGCWINNITEQQLSQIEKLILQSGIRGIHATGISFLTDKIETITKHGSSSSFLRNNDLSKCIHNGNLRLIAHTRYSTSDLRYNQPIGNQQISISHNGVISQEPKENWKELFNLTTETNNDSELIYQAFQNGEDPLVKFEGSMAVCILTDKNLVAFRNAERPLWYSELDNGIVFASTNNILERSHFENNSKCEMFTKYEYSDKLTRTKVPIPIGVVDLQ
jgi:glutamine phosphoribosylpyrophosphate amidotransferase